jgi:hypothetical protein
VPPLLAPYNCLATVSLCFAPLRTFCHPFLMAGVPQCTVCVPQEEFKGLAKWWKESLGAAVENVKVSKRLATTPCVVVSSKVGQQAASEPGGCHALLFSGCFMLLLAWVMLEARTASNSKPCVVPTYCLLLDGLLTGLAGGVQHAHLFPLMRLPRALTMHPGSPLTPYWLISCVPLYRFPCCSTAGLPLWRRLRGPRPWVMLTGPST